MGYIFDQEFMSWLGMAVGRVFLGTQSVPNPNKTYLAYPVGFGMDLRLNIKTWMGLGFIPRYLLPEPDKTKP